MFHQPSSTLKSPVAAVCNRHAIFLLGMADAIRRHVASRFPSAPTVTDRRYNTSPLPDNY